MGKTKTEIYIEQVDVEKLKKLILYMYSNRYQRGEYKGHVTWVKSSVCLWSTVNVSYYCVQFHLDGNRLVIEEWVYFHFRLKLPVTGLPAVLVTFGTSLYHHVSLMNFLESL